MAWPAIIGAIGALGSAGLQANAQGAAADASSGAAKAQAQNAAMAQWYQQMQQEQYQKPYAEMGLSNLPLLEYLTSGVMPEQTTLTSDEVAELNRFRGTSAPGAGTIQRELGTKGRASDSQWVGMSYDDLLSARRMYSSSATGNRNNQRLYAGFVSGIDKQLARYNELADKERKAAAYKKLSSGNFLQESPLYRWQQQQGEQGINRAMAARGMYNSSAATNQLSRFNTQLGAEETERQYGRIAGLVSQGQTGVNNYMTSGQNTSNALANVYANLGNQLGNNAMIQGQQRAELIGQTSGNLMDIYSQYQFQNANKDQGARSSYDWASGSYK